MLILIIFSFLAGIVTILSPCILPILPVILSSSVDSSGKRRPLGIVSGFVLSFTFFTLFLASIVKWSGIPSDALRYIAIAILAFFGFSMLFPKLQSLTEQFFSRFASSPSNNATRHGFWGGLVIGFSIGLLWTPCVGPILAAVISLAVSESVSLQVVLITIAYSIGTALPMFALLQLGSTVLQKIPWLLKNTARIQKGFGVVMILIAGILFFNLDRKFQTFMLNAFPGYGSGLTNIDSNLAVKNALGQLTNNTDNSLIGSPLNLSSVKGPYAPEIIPGGSWFNSSPLRLADLKGKVVIIDFWTYSCINCQRTLPYLESWYKKYQSEGLVIIGVHTPEFEFEHEAGNVAQAIKDFGITYPVVQDNNYSTWTAYNNSYWPAEYFIDKDGYIRYTHFGEGNYDEKEQVIRDLLKETGANLDSNAISNPTYQVFASTPETYLGYARLGNLTYSEHVVPDSSFNYNAPSNLDNDSFAYNGSWNIGSEFASPQAGAQLTLNFSAKSVYLVMSPVNAGTNGQVKVYIDGKLQYFTADNITGMVTIDQARLYHLVELTQPGRHVLQLDFLDSNTKIYAFTFG